MMADGADESNRGFSEFCGHDRFRVLVLEMLLVGLQIGHQRLKVYEISHNLKARISRLNLLLLLLSILTLFWREIIGYNLNLPF